MPPEILRSITLRDDRVLLRAVEENVSTAIHEAIVESLNELCRWMAWCRIDYDRAETDGFAHAQPQAWQEAREYGFVILDRHTERLLGCCGLNHLDWLNLMANLGYWVRTSACGRGIATAATKLVLRFAFEQLGLQRVEIVAAEGNIASQRVAEKVGAMRECLARNRCRAAGVQQDAYIYSVIPDDLGVD
jgi:ribosomal-protein-serine acetyltransferase